MTTSYNPFDDIFNRLNRMEIMLRSICEEKMPLHRNKDPDQWFDLKGLIEYLPFKPKEQTIYDWVHKGIIPFHKVPNTKMLVFLQSDINEWLKSGRRKTQAEKGTEVNKYLNFKKQ
jgi:hypothetical protein